MSAKGSDTPKVHTPKQTNDEVHQALKRVEIIEKRLDSTGLLEKSAENVSWFGLIFSGIVIICMLGTATGRLYQKYNRLANVGDIWEIFAYMITATVFLGLYFGTAIKHMILGRYVIFYALFFATLVFGLAVFMNLVAVRSRILPQ
jgi:FlaA1/EpsC-like NDP-sugar epimerase